MQVSGEKNTSLAAWESRREASGESSSVGVLPHRGLCSLQTSAGATIAAFPHPALPTCSPLDMFHSGNDLQFANPNFLSSTAQGLWADTTNWDFHQYNRILCLILLALVCN